LVCEEEKKGLVAGLLMGLFLTGTRLLGVPHGIEFYEFAEIVVPPILMDKIIYGLDNCLFGLLGWVIGGVLKSKPSKLHRKKVDKDNL
jgi:hypothetical protein